MVFPDLNSAASEAAVALKWQTKGDKFLADYGSGSSEVAIFFLEVGAGLRFLETADIVETMSSLMVVLLPPKEPEPFANIFIYLSESIFMNY